MLPLRNISDINNHFKMLGIKELNVCKPTSIKKEMTNVRNINGKQGEDLVENAIILSGVSYASQVTQIIPESLKPYFHQINSLKYDFLVNINGKEIIIESKYQATSGSVKDKIAGFIRDYKRLNKPVILVLNGEGFGENFIEVENNILKLDSLDHLFTIIDGKDLLEHLNNLK